MVRVRIGPSPTGDPHVGTAYMALFNYAFAKLHGGQFLLRIEDTDQARSQAPYERGIMDALRWLGLNWDEGPDVGGPHGPYRQSERAAIYAEHAKMLEQRGAAYPCFCTAERLASLRLQQRQRGAATGYDGLCRRLLPAEVQNKREQGVPSVLRLKTPGEGDLTFEDALRGPVAIGAEQIDDQVLIKSDGLPTYHLANVVDDHLMGITHVIRAEEWLSSTPKHVLLYRGFGWQLPTFVHMPLLRNADKSKISKRKNPVSINFYRESGFLPEALLNYLAMMGWTMPDGREKFSVADFTEALTLERITLGGPVFDVAKLTWLNGLYLREEPAQALLQRWRDTTFGDDVLARVAPLIHERVQKLEDVLEYASFFFVGDVPYDAEAMAALVPKGKTAADAAELLGSVAEALDKVAEFSASELEQVLRGLCANLGTKTKELFMPVRVATTGRKATPPLFDTLAVLGKERCRRRLRNAITALKALPTSNL